MTYFATANEMSEALSLPLLAHGEFEGRFLSRHQRLSGYAVEPFQSGGFYHRWQDRVRESTGRSPSDSITVWVTGPCGSLENLPWAIGLAEQIARKGGRPYLAGTQVEGLRPRGGARGETIPRVFFERSAVCLPENALAVTSDIEGVRLIVPGGEDPPTLIPAEAEGGATLVVSEALPEAFDGPYPDPSALDGAVLVVAFRDHDIREIRGYADGLKAAGIRLLGMVAMGPHASENGRTTTSSSSPRKTSEGTPILGMPSIDAGSRGLPPAEAPKSPDSYPRLYERGPVDQDPRDAKRPAADGGARNRSITPADSGSAEEPGMITQTSWGDLSGPNGGRSWKSRPRPARRSPNEVEPESDPAEQTVRLDPVAPPGKASEPKESVEPVEPVEPNTDPEVTRERLVEAAEVARRELEARLQSRVQPAVSEGTGDSTEADESVAEDRLPRAARPESSVSSPDAAERIESSESPDVTAPRSAATAGPRAASFVGSGSATREAVAESDSPRKVQGSQVALLSSWQKETRRRGRAGRLVAQLALGAVGVAAIAGVFWGAQQMWQGREDQAVAPTGGVEDVAESALAEATLPGATAAPESGDLAQAAPDQVAAGEDRPEDDTPVSAFAEPFRPVATPVDEAMTGQLDAHRATEDPVEDLAAGLGLSTEEAESVADDVLGDAKPATESEPPAAATSKESARSETEARPEPGPDIAAAVVRNQDAGAAPPAAKQADLADSPASPDKPVPSGASGDDGRSGAGAPAPDVPEETLPVEETAAGTEVAIERLSPPVAALADTFVVHFSSFRLQDDAAKEAARLRGGGIEARYVYVHIPGKGPWYRVVTGAYPSFEEARVAGLAIGRQHDIALMHVIRKGGRANPVPIVN